MRCRVCRGKAVFEVRRHNAAFCSEHLIEHVQRQVARAVDEFKMFGSGDKLLLGVSGGKDSLALWDILSVLGFRVDGLNLQLGIGDYSSESTSLTRSFADERGFKLHEVDLVEEHGFSIPQAAASSSRTACSACGLAKRYLLNDTAIRLGYDVLVMGHNLDDEAATLFSNVMTWDTDFLGRQSPVLPATSSGLLKKAKPLIRVAERETAAYAFLRGIQYEVDECPMAAGNTLNRLKGILDELERLSPGTKHRFTFGFIERGSPLFSSSSEVDLQACSSCSAPTTNTECSFCRLRRNAVEGAK